MNKLRTILTFILSTCLALSSFVLMGFSSENPASITRSTTIDVNGKEVVKTEILLDKTTTREDLIHACKFLAEEEVQLTFETLSIRKAFFGLVGKPRIAYAKGKIELPNGSIEQFEAGGAIGFQSIKITYSRNREANDYFIDMVEIVD